MITEDDDDTHICLKCHTTITGLDNYISHRKSGCNAQANEHSKPRNTLSPLIPPDESDFALKADDFFSLLELQSSSKKSTLQVPSGGKTGSGVLTRSKATAVIQASNPSRASDWIGGHQLRELGNVDNQTKLINAADRISGNQIKKDEPRRLTYEDLDEESNDDYEEDEEEFEDEDAPPRSHTGGKWKPTSSPIQWLRPSSVYSHHDDRSDWNTPPPSHTGGKWKPTLPTQTRQISEGDEDDDKNAPPPDHTKGKWIPMETLPNSDEIPPLRKSSGTIQYWCGPCNRSLTSKIVYDRHLRSELHFKRTLHEREFDNPSEYLTQKSLTPKRAEGKRIIKNPMHLWPQENETNIKQNFTKTKVKKLNFIKCKVCRSKVLIHLMGKHLISHYHCRKRNFFKSEAQQMVLDNIHSIVHQAPFQCSACRFYCNKQSDLLRHWHSKEHHSVQEITAGIFLCTFCKFESGNNDVMAEHLISSCHMEVISVINRSVPIVIKRISPVLCSSCGKQFKYNAELRQHCLRLNHLLNNTVSDKYQARYCCPDCNLVLKSRKALQRHLKKRHNKPFYFCSVCALTFNTSLEAKFHRKNEKHKYSVLSRNYDKGYGSKDLTRSCQYCYIRCPNASVLKSHLQKEHPEHNCTCPQCGKKFTLSQEVTQHIKSKSCSFDSSIPAYYNCEICPYKTNSKGDYYFHKALHSQPLTMYEDDENGGASTKPSIMRYKCPICGKFFRKSSLRCHVRLHTNERPYVCHICKASYARKNNLVDHIKQRHKEEFNKRKAQQKCVGAKSDLIEIPKEKAQREKKFLCSICGKSFLKKFTLGQHAKIHAGKEVACSHPGCLYRARTLAELKPHMATHSDLQPFACQYCDYCTKTKAQLVRHLKIHDTGDNAKKYTCSFCEFTTRLHSHLRRHVRVHTGAKPYKCPHCTYSCNNLENLRKHVLSTNKHPGKCLYECTYCEHSTKFTTNLAKDLRYHLLTTHANQFDSAKKATSYITGIYHSEDDSKPTTSTKVPPSQLEVTKKDFPTSTLLTPRSQMNQELMSIVIDTPKEDVVYVEMPTTATDSWTMEGYYDVEESGSLVPFHSDDEDLLVEHFTDDSQ